MIKRYFILFFMVLGCIVTLATARGSYRLEKNGGDAATVPSGSAVTGDLSRAVFSMDIKDEPLKDVLERISDQNGITFSLPPSLGEEKVMMRFSNLTLEECLDKLLDPYNRIFVYQEDRSVPASPTRRLTEVRIFPHQYEGRVREPVMKIAEGDAEVTGEVRVKDTRKDAGKSAGASEKREKTYIEDLTTTLKGRDRQAKLDAVEVLRDAGTVDALRALSVGMRDKDPRVQQEAVDALKKVGEELKDLADTGTTTSVPESDGDDEKSSGRDTDPSNDPDPEPVPRPTLTVESISGNSSSFTLDNEGEVGAVQFDVKGTQVIDVRTTARTEGYFVKSTDGRVILIPISGGSIASGTGPIVEIDHSGGSVYYSGYKDEPPHK